MGGRGVLLKTKIKDLGLDFDLDHVPWMCKFLDVAPLLGVGVGVGGVWD